MLIMILMAAFLSATLLVGYYILLANAEKLRNAPTSGKPKNYSIYDRIMKKFFKK